MAYDLHDDFYLNCAWGDLSGFFSDHHDHDHDHGLAPVVGCVALAGLGSDTTLFRNHVVQTWYRNDV